MIRLENVSKSFGEKKVLGNFSFEIPDGEICFFLGKSGTGKSVLLKVLLGLMEPDEGKIFIDEFLVNGISANEHRRLFRRCGIVFQFPALLDFLTVGENVMMAVEGFAKLTPETAAGLATEWLAQVALAPRIASQYPTELSFGIQKRVAIARALAVGPRHLLFDEPTTGLDPIASDAIHDLIRGVARARRMTAVVVSHDLRRALRVADRLFLLEKGEIVFQGTPEQFSACPHPIAREFIQASRLVELTP